MATEILSVDQFPDINWSTPRTHQDGDPDSTYGIIEIASNHQILRITADHQLTKIDSTQPFVNSRLRFGKPGRPSFTLRASSSSPFSTDDSNRINHATETCRQILTTLHQMEAASKITYIGDQLLLVLRLNIGYGSHDHLQDIGVVEDLLNRYTTSLSTERLLTNARELQELEVPLLYEGVSTMTSGMTWTTKELIQYYKTGHCPPLPVAQYLD